MAKEYAKNDGYDDHSLNYRHENTIKISHNSKNAKNDGNNGYSLNHHHHENYQNPKLLQQSC